MIEPKSEVKSLFFETMNFREASNNDISQMLEIRFSVKENVLQSRSLVTEEITNEFLTERGKGWVCESTNQILGFAIVDLKEKNVWALFIRPGFEGKGIGQNLQQLMLDWYFSKTKEKIWLGTAPGTRAEKFYRQSGWKDVGVTNYGEIRFEMSFDEWESINVVEH